MACFLGENIANFTLQQPGSDLSSVWTFLRGSFETFKQGPMALLLFLSHFRKRAGTLRGCLASSLLDCQDFYLTLQKSLSSIMVFFLEFWCVRCWCHVGIFTSRLGSEPQSQHAFYGTQSLYSNSFSSLLLHIPSLSPLLLLLPFLSQLVTGTHSENTAFSTPAPQVCKRKIAHLSSSEAVGPFSWIIEWLPDW